MDDLEVLKKLQAETAPCGEILGLQVPQVPIRSP